MRADRALFMLAGLMLAGATARPVAWRTAQTPADPQDLFRDDVHAKAGLSCASCHAGAPPYGPIERTKIAQLCARCHSDADYMKKYNPQVRVDQYQQYLTSTHGKKMSTGETRVATCTDCHGAHGIRAVSDPRASVAPQHVANTCSRCHADRARMAAFGHEDSPPDDWKASVHAAALLKRGDTSAPTCTHLPRQPRRGASGSHLGRVRLLAVPRARGRAVPQEPEEGRIRRASAQGECLTCHSNHRIEKPSDSFIGMQDPALCARCHNDELKGADTHQVDAEEPEEPGGRHRPRERRARSRRERRDAGRRRTAGRCAMRTKTRFWRASACTHLRRRRLPRRQQRASRRPRTPRRSATRRSENCGIGATASPSPR